MSGLPKNWAQCSIGEISRPIGGGTPSSKNSGYFTNDGIPWITPADLSGYSSMYIERGRRSLTDEGFAASSAQMLPVGSVLFSSRAPIGYVAIAANALCTSQGFKSFPMPDGVDSRFAYYYFKMIKPIAEAMATGTTFKELSGAAAARLPFVLAPLNEQKRIADKLDSLLARVDACRERLDRIPTILKRLRQSILAAACCGKLTADWREEHPNLEQSESLSTRIESERFDLWCDAMHRKAKADGRQLTGTVWQERYEEPCEIDLTNLPELPSNWMWKPFDSFTAQFQYGPRFGEGEYTDSDNGIPTVRTSDMNFRGEITLNNPPRVVVADHALDHFILLPDDMVITRTGATIGKCALYSEALGPAIASAYLIRYRLTKNTTIPRFVLTVLMSPWGQENLLGGMRAVAQPNINTTTIAKIPVPIPPVAEQIEIVRRVELLLALADNVERKLEAGFLALSRAVPSILSKAFRGELVPQDANDEPAEELLTRIRNAIASDVSKPREKKSGKRIPKKKAAETMLKRADVQSNHLTEILRSNGPLTAEALWNLSQLEIDDFYDQLKTEEEKGLLKERRKKGADEVRLLEVA